VNEMALDNERCHVAGCTVHRGWIKLTPITKRDAQIIEDFQSGDWSVQELSSFWGLSPLRISKIAREANTNCESAASLQVAGSR